MSSLPSNFGNELEPIFTDLISESQSESCEQVDISIDIRNKVTVNLNASRFEPQTSAQTPPNERNDRRHDDVSVKCSIDLNRIKNMGALLKHKSKILDKTKLKAKVTKRRKQHPPNSDVLGSILSEMDKSRTGSVRSKVNLPPSLPQNDVCKAKNLDVVALPILERIHWDNQNASHNEMLNRV